MVREKPIQDKAEEWQVRCPCSVFFAHGPTSHFDRQTTSTSDDRIDKSLSLLPEYLSLARNFLNS